MRKTLSVVAALASILALGALAQASGKEDAFLGTWAGTWTGGSEGTFEMTLAKGADKKLGGSITPSPSNGETYTATLRTVTIEDQKLTATFDSPDGTAEATVSGTLEAGTLKGTYSIKEKSQGAVVETGTWTTKKK